jgi:hypothetical protein
MSKTVTEKTTRLKEAETSTTEALVGTCCVVSTYIYPPIYFSVTKPVSKEVK